MAVTLNRIEDPVIADPKRLYRTIEGIFESLTASSERALIEEMARVTTSQFRESCGIGRWVVCNSERDPHAPAGSLQERIFLAVRPDGPKPVTFVVDDRALVIWSLSGPRSWLVAFELSEEATDDITLLMRLLRNAAQQRLSDDGWTSLFHRAHAIQQGLLPAAPFVSLPGFDLFARSDPAEIVGGDVYDIRPLTRNTISLLLADASGHGFPAALQARDVVIGMRMGSESNMKIVATVEKLNRVLHESSLVTQFVSLIYGELDEDGVFQFVNAGHPSALVVSERSIDLLPQTGPVLGFSSDSVYHLGHAVLPPRSALVMYSDGILEAAGPDDEQFGIERIASIVLEHLDSPPERIIDRLFQGLDLHRNTAPRDDDMTLLVARRDSNLDVDALRRSRRVAKTYRINDDPLHW